MNSRPRDLFYSLLHAESEGEVDIILDGEGLLCDSPSLWRPYGDLPNNISTVGGQQSKAIAAFVEKVINSVDAVLMRECWRAGIDPEDQAAPRTMAQASERFFGIRGGRLENETAVRRTQLADDIHIVVTGEKGNPNYMVIDQGEGQCPQEFPDTLVSIGKENKVGIHFVQGKYNAGGTGALPFCGEKKYQLIVSRRHPNLPGDSSKDSWGFTLVRRLRPTGHRLNSMYVYLAPSGQIQTFPADEIRVFPGQGAPNVPPKPYAAGLAWGTCIKLYAYKMERKGLATTELRREMEKQLYTLCLPVRITETREYRANYYSTTACGTSINIADHESKGRIEPAFPDSGGLNLDGIGNLPVIVTVYKETDEEGNRITTRDITRDIPSGVSFLVNGQIQASLGSEFLERRIDRGYVRKYTVVAVDCTAMSNEVREEFFMTSRDRVRSGSDVYKDVIGALEEYLKQHEGLKEVNARRRLERVKQHEEEGPIDVFTELIKADPALAELLPAGARIHRPFGPGTRESTPFKGKRFPTYFRLKNEPPGGLVKEIPINSSARVQFETDAENKYFSRGDDPGSIEFVPSGLNRSFNLKDGTLTARFVVPVNARLGDQLRVTVTATDITRVDNPFRCEFRIGVARAVESRASSISGTRKPRSHGDGQTEDATLSIPPVKEVYKEDWADYDFDDYSGLAVMPDGKGSYDFFVNMDNIYLLKELRREKRESEIPVLKYWFRYGLALVALGLLHEDRRHNQTSESRGVLGAESAQGRDGYGDFIDRIRYATQGVSSVILPIIRQLAKGPLSS